MPKKKPSARKASKDTEKIAPPKKAKAKRKPRKPKAVEPATEAPAPAPEPAPEPAPQGSDAPLIAELEAYRQERKAIDAQLPLLEQAMADAELAHRKTRSRGLHLDGKINALEARLRR